MSYHDKEEHGPFFNGVLLVYFGLLTLCAGLLGLGCMLALSNGKDQTFASILGNGMLTFALTLLIGGALGMLMRMASLDC